MTTITTTTTTATSTTTATGTSSSSSSSCSSPLGSSMVMLYKYHHHHHHQYHHPQCHHCHDHPHPHPHRRRQQRMIMMVICVLSVNLIIWHLRMNIRQLYDYGGIIIISGGGGSNSSHSSPTSSSKTTTTATFVSNNSNKNNRQSENGRGGRVLGRGRGLRGPRGTEQGQQPSSSSLLLLLNEPVGYVTRMCRRRPSTTTTANTTANTTATTDATGNEDDPNHRCLLVPIPSSSTTTNDGQNNRPDCPDTNGPKPVYARSWMHGSFRPYELLLYYSSHRTRRHARGGSSSGGGSSSSSSSSTGSTDRTIRILGARKRYDMTTYEHVPVAPTFPSDVDGSFPCASVHSPSILVNDEIRQLTMYVHGHNCTGGLPRGKQPTLVLTSSDGLNWTYVPNRNNSGSSSRRRSGSGNLITNTTDAENNTITNTTSYLFDDLFYMTQPTQVGKSFYYALAKTQEDGIGSTILLRCRIPPRTSTRDDADPRQQHHQQQQQPCQHSHEYERGPIVARGLRHTDIMHVEEKHSTATTSAATTLTSYTMYVLFTMIGDDPERIHLGTIDIPVARGDNVNDQNDNRNKNNDNSSSGETNKQLRDDWMDAELLPGPEVLAPERQYEHGGALLSVVGEKSTTTGPSQSGPAGCDPHTELRDPAFLADPEYMDNDGNVNHRNPKHWISGTLFYAVQGERSLAVARLVLDTKAYQKAIQYRDRSYIEPSVQAASSLQRQPTQLLEEEDKSVVGGVEEDHPQSPPLLPYGRTLITGTGRSGTTYLCKYFNRIGIHISHDNTIDCGDQYPGVDGAVSWYDAFDSGRRYSRVLHVVRDPIRVIQSRAYKHLDFTYNTVKNRVLLDYSQRIADFIGKYEDLAELHLAINSLSTDHVAAERYMYIYSLKHWVRRNSFVDRHASWRERIETLSNDAMSFWKLCMAGGFASMCPNLDKIREVTKASDPKINSSYSQQHVNVTDTSQQARKPWVMPPNSNSNTMHPTITTRRVLADGDSNSSISSFRGQTTLSWEELEDIIRSARSAGNERGINDDSSTIEKDLSYVAIAKAMGQKYGYYNSHDNGPMWSSPGDPSTSFDDTTMIPDYECNFDNSGLWDCWILSMQQQ